MSYAFIQSCSSAIGQNLTRGLLSRTKLHVVGSARDPQRAREAILSSGEVDEDRLTVLKMDVTDERSIEAAAREVKSMYGEKELRLLLNLSGVLNAEKSIAKVDAQKALESFQINTLGHLLTFKHFLPLVPTDASLRSSSSEDLANGLLPPKLSLLGSLTARVGSISDNRKGGWVSYRASKAATNQIIMTLQRELEVKSAAAIAVALHPGTVAGTPLSKEWTDTGEIGKKRGVLSAEQSAEHLLDVIKGLSAKDGGKFYDWAGKEVQW